jgi:hypothetical protein
MNRILKVVLVLAVLLAFPAVTVNRALAETQVAICHVPPGNPDNPHTIMIGESAVPSHLANHPLDRVGACVCTEFDEFGHCLNP